MYRIWDAADGDDIGAVDAFEELDGKEGFDLVGAHFGNIFAAGGADLDVFPLAFDVDDFGEQDFHLPLLDGNEDEVPRIRRIDSFWDCRTVGPDPATAVKKRSNSIGFRCSRLR